MRNLLDPEKRAKGSANLSIGEFTELLRLVGSLELLPKQEKTQLGKWLLELYGVKKWAAARGAILWTVGRLGSRVPVYGPLNNVVEIETVIGWLERLLLLESDESNWALAIMQCARRTHDRYRDIDHSLRRSIIARLHAAPAHYLSLIEHGGSPITSEATQIIGESLPLGLRLR